MPAACPVAPPAFEMTVREKQRNGSDLKYERWWFKSKFSNGGRKCLLRGGTSALASYSIGSELLHSNGSCRQGGHTCPEPPADWERTCVLWFWGCLFKLSSSSDLPLFHWPLTPSPGPRKPSPGPPGPPKYSSRAPHGTTVDRLRVSPSRGCRPMGFVKGFVLWLTDWLTGLFAITGFFGGASGRVFRVFAMFFRQFSINLSGEFSRKIIKHNFWTLF